ncbi:MAG: patatin-like phospholipase family protein [Thermodesulfobacteriota bacterium]|nr:patatin-like phospholipase family protein [Thermodesulfobacteriota bacterium]
MTTPNDKKISLVLGSGGARGLAHIGVIQWLEENGYRIGSIAGCSMGALIGGIYAAGKLDVFEKWVRAITKRDIVALMDISWQKSGLVKGDRIINTLRDLVGDMAIEDLSMPYTAVATDIKNGKEIWINSGSLFDAIRASISLPLFFTPFRCSGTDFIDGGILNPVPIAPTFGDKTDMTIAVNLCASVRKSDPPEPVQSPPPEEPGFREKISRFIKSFQDNDDEPAERENDWGANDIISRAFDIMQSSIARQKLAAYPPDITIEISRQAGGLLEFDRAAELIDLGYRQAREHFRRERFAPSSAAKDIQED